jgi:hypothetical protein
MKKGFASGDWLAGGNFNIRAVESTFTRTDRGRYQVLIRLSQREVTSYGPGGKVYAVIEEAPPGVQIMEATYRDGEWTAENVETIAE